jgi:triosephosphate isomerase
MDKTYIIANWKSNKTQKEAQEWANAFKDVSYPEEKEVIVCPPFTLLAMIAWFTKVNNLPLKIGAQNISAFPAGSYTGEIYAEQVKEYTTHTIIGHSERRKLFHESDEEIVQKVINAQAAGLEIIFCVQDQHTPIPQGVTVVAYEPVSAIGSGNPDTPENAATVAREIKEKNIQVIHIVYGGSVTGENVKSFTSLDVISGVLVGKASLDPHSFQSIIQNA